MVWDILIKNNLEKVRRKERRPGVFI